jgi:hypothetical protein
VFDHGRRRPKERFSLAERLTSIRILIHVSAEDFRFDSHIPNSDLEICRKITVRILIGSFQPNTVGLPLTPLCHVITRNSALLQKNAVCSRTFRRILLLSWTHQNNAWASFFALVEYQFCRNERINSKCLEMSRLIQLDIHSFSTEHKTPNKDNKQHTITSRCSLAQSINQSQYIQMNTKHSHDTFIFLPNTKQLQTQKHDRNATTE